METPRRSARILKKTTQVSLENGRGFSVVEKTIVEHGSLFKYYVYLLESLIPLVSWILSIILHVFYNVKKYFTVLVIFGILLGIYYTTYNTRDGLYIASKPQEIVEVMEQLEVMDVGDVGDLYIISEEAKHPKELKELKEKVDNISMVLENLELMDWKKELKKEIGREIQKLNILNENQVLEMINSRDKRAERVDYALRTRGASVVGASRDYKVGLGSKWLKFLFPAVQRVSRNKVNRILESSKSPGDCWAMSGSSGFVNIVLSQKVIPGSVVIQHASLQELSGFKTAPKRIQVYSRNILLGNGTFDPRDEESSIVMLKNISSPIDSIRVQILSNWGHQDYTCIYQIQVFS